MSGAIDELNSYFRFQILDLPRERRLRQVQIFSCFGKAQCLCDSNEIMNVAQFHFRLIAPFRF